MNHDETVRTVVATLRTVAEQIRDERDRADLLAVAAEVETDVDDMCCPLCQEVVCDETCPLEQVRTGEQR